MGNKFKYRAALAIRDERDRQKTIEGWDAEHDDRHVNGEMLAASEAYFVSATSGQKSAPNSWPWGAEWWKPKTPERDLARAGALALAEIDRLHRAKHFTCASRARAGKIYSKCRDALAELLEKEAANA